MEPIPARTRTIDQSNRYPNRRFEFTRAGGKQLDAPGQFDLIFVLRNRLRLRNSLRLCLRHKLRNSLHLFLRHKLRYKKNNA